MKTYPETPIGQPKPKQKTPRERMVAKLIPMLEHFGYSDISLDYWSNSTKGANDLWIWEVLFKAKNTDGYAVILEAGSYCSLKECFKAKHMAISHHFMNTYELFCGDSL